MLINIALDADDAMEIKWYYCVDPSFQGCARTDLEVGGWDYPLPRSDLVNLGDDRSGLFSAIEDYFVDWFPA
jgi:hypothetical protein